MNEKDLLTAIAEADTDFINESAQFDTVKSKIKAQKKKKALIITSMGLAFVLSVSALGMGGRLLKNKGEISTYTQTEKDGQQSGDEDAADIGTEDVDSPDIHKLLDIQPSDWTKRDDIVWGETDQKGYSFENSAPPGGTIISEELKTLMKGRPENTVYAVMVEYGSCVDEEIENWRYDGDTISELQKELAELNKGGNPYTVTYPDGSQSTGYTPSEENKERATELIEKIRKIRAEYLNMRVKGFEETFANNGGLEIFTDNKISSENTVFYTFATKAQLENFKAKPTEAFIFFPAAKLK